MVKHKRFSGAKKEHRTVLFFRLCFWMPGGTGSAGRLI